MNLTTSGRLWYKKPSQPQGMIDQVFDSMLLSFWLTLGPPVAGSEGNEDEQPPGQKVVTGKSVGLEPAGARLKLQLGHMLTVCSCEAIYPFRALSSGDLQGVKRHRALQQGVVSLGPGRFCPLAGLGLRPSGRGRAGSHCCEGRERAGLPRRPVCPPPSACWCQANHGGESAIWLNLTRHFSIWICLTFSV